MIKRCPECNRTYSDESISFCLADGALLSAPYDAIREEPPPTEILPSARTPVPPTEPPKPAVPTMTSLSGGQNYASLEVDRSEPRRRSSGVFVWVALALLVVGAIVIGIFGVRRVLNKPNDAVATSSPETLLAENTSSPTDSSQVTPTTSTTATEPASNRSNVNASQSETKTSSPPEAKVIFSPAPPAPGRAEPLAPPPANNQTPETKQPEAIDYNQVFAQREVDTKAQLLSRPKPSYTDSARQENVQGTVVLRVVLSANGSVGSVTPIRGLSHGLTEKAIAAAKQIRFSPAIKDGRPVSVAVTVEYHFSVY